MTEPNPPDRTGSPRRERPAPTGNRDREPDRAPDRAPDRGPSRSPDQRPDQRPVLPPWLPAAVVALGILLLAVTVRAAGGLNHGVADGLAHSFRPPVAILAFLALVAVAATYAKYRDEGYGILRRAGNACAVLLAVAAILVPVGLIMLGMHPATYPPPPKQTTQPTTDMDETLPPVSPPPTRRVHPHTAAHWWTSLAGFVVTAILAAIVVLVVVVIINILKRSRVDLSGRDRAYLGDLDDAEDLADAVAAATEALEYEGRTREAVIACYAAMENSIDEAGVGRQSADTPEELLKRATTAGLVPAEAGARLTDLFREARFSQHPMTEEHRAEARAALAEISDHLRAVRAPQNAGAAS
jgi:hypothetical protein